MPLIPLVVPMPRLVPLNENFVSSPAVTPPPLYCTALAPPAGTAVTPVSIVPSPINFPELLARMSPNTSKTFPGVTVPMPTLPAMIAIIVPALGVVHVPTPTGPSTASLVCGVVVPIPKLSLTLKFPL